jgi:hypothetical protein
MQHAVDDPPPTRNFGSFCRRTVSINVGLFAMSIAPASSEATIAWGSRKIWNTSSSNANGPVPTT